MKRKTLREKIVTVVIQFCNGDITFDLLDLRILRLIRDDRKRHCAECQRVKTLIEKQIEKFEKM